MRKRVLSVLLAMSMICSGILVVPAYADTSTTSGKCGYNVYWTLDNTGTLTITGTGKMDDYKAPPTSQASPFFNDKNIKNIIIEGGVTYIGNYAFAGCENLSSITLLPGVEEIGNWSFYACKNLKTVTLPKTINRIGAAFVNCYELSNITLPDSLQFIGDCAFQHTNISSIVIPQGIERIEYATFAYCNNLKAISIPKSVTTFGLSAFLDCNNLTDVYYEGSAEEWNRIGNNADVITYTSFAPSYGDYGNSDVRNAYLHYNGYIKVLLNGQTISFSYPPIVKDGRTLVPLRAIFEAMGATVDWNNDTKTVTSTLNSTTIQLTIGSNLLYKNGTAVTLDVPAQLINGYTMVPARAVAEAFGAEVKWDGDTRTVYIDVKMETHGIIIYADAKYNEIAAMAFKDVLQKNLLGTNDKDIHCLFEPNEETYNNTMLMVKENAKQGDITYFYYAGHGDDDGGIYPDYNDESNTDTYMKTPSQLIDDLKQIPGTIVLILESCHSGAIQNVEGLDKEKFKIITSSQSDQYSDTDHLGLLGFVENKSLGAFSEAFLNALGGLEGNNPIYNTITERDGEVKADYNKDNNVSFAELFRYIDDNMDHNYNYKLQNFRQDPTSSNIKDETIIFSY